MYPTFSFKFFRNSHIFTFLIILIFSSLISFSFSLIGAQNACKTEKNGVCTSCNNGYVLSDGKCLGCSDGYVSTPFNLGGYYACQSCISNCGYCEDNSFEKCAYCKDGFYFNSTTESCNSCIPNCKRCRDNTTDGCMECQLGYYKNLRLNECKECSKNCKYCVGDYYDLCLLCDDGYYNGRFQCEPCATGCKRCVDGSLGGCTEFMDGYFIQGKSNIGNCIDNCQICTDKDFSACVKCNDGFFKDLRTQTCQKCVKKCNVCDDSTINGCKSCQSGFYKDTKNGICSPCVKNCRTCSSGLFEDCSECNIGYYKDEETQICESCPTSCYNCTNSTSCGICQYGYTKVGDECKKINYAKIDVRNGETPLLAFSEIYQYKFHSNKYKNGIYFKMHFFSFAQITEGHTFNSEVILKKWKKTLRRQESSDEGTSASDEDNDKDKDVDTDTDTEESSDEKSDSIEGDFPDRLGNGPLDRVQWDIKDSVATCILEGKGISASNDTASEVDYECYVDSEEYDVLLLNFVPPKSMFISGWPLNIEERNATRFSNKRLSNGVPSTTFSILGSGNQKCSTYKGKIYFDYYGVITGTTPEKKETFKIDLLQPSGARFNCTMKTEIIDNEDGTQEMYGKLKCFKKMRKSFDGDALIGTGIVKLTNGNMLIRGDYNHKLTEVYCKFVKDDGLFDRGFGIWETLFIFYGVACLVILIFAGIYLFRLIKRLRKRANIYIQEQSNNQPGTSNNDKVPNDVQKSVSVSNTQQENAQNKENKPSVPPADNTSPAK